MNWSKVLVALVGAVVGALLVGYFGLNFRLGPEWFLDGNAAIIPSAIAGAIVARVIQHLLSRAGKGRTS
jgi:uncharacterized membrane protein YeaQ/YmgE (transglycosylase-associated protein family)